MSNGAKGQLSALTALYSEKSPLQSPRLGQVGGGGKIGRYLPAQPKTGYSCGIGLSQNAAIAQSPLRRTLCAEPYAQNRRWPMTRGGKVWICQPFVPTATITARWGISDEFTPFTSRAHPVKCIAHSAGQPRASGSVAEWFKALVLKTSVGGSLPWVRIPPLPPNFNQKIQIKYLRRRYRASHPFGSSFMAGVMPPMPLCPAMACRQAAQGMLGLFDAFDDRLVQPFAPRCVMEGVIKAPHVEGGCRAGRLHWPWVSTTITCGDGL